MSKQLIGYIIQGAGILAVAVAAFFGAPAIRALIVGGAAAFGVGYFMRKLSA